MISTRHLAVVAAAAALTALGGSASAAPTRDPGMLQGKNPNVNYAFNEDFTVPTSPVPEGNAVGRVVPVDAASPDSGCEASDFAGFPAGSIALVRRGICPFAQKVLNAQAAGATGVLIFNSFTGLSNISLSGADVTVPVLFITQELGQSFVAAASDLRVHMMVHHQPAPATS
jgi:hypothetical protein